MKKTIIYTLSAILMLTFVSCNQQKPSRRDDPWGNEDTTMVDAAVVQTFMSSKKVLVPFKRIESGLIEVQVSLNGVPFNMLWDTAASMCQISYLEFVQLAKSGKIGEEDMQGIAMTSLADASLIINKVFNIKEIYIQGKDNKYLRLQNVSFLVTDNTETPVLLGQNVIKELPRHSFDEESEWIEFEKPEQGQ